MKTIGLIGGMSWESTVTYYQVINETVKERLGGLHSARLVLYSVEFSELAALMARGDWTRVAEVLTGAARALERAGADIILLCTNTMHRVAPEIQRAVSVPFLHIADAAADALEAAGIRRVALLGTKTTMTQDFYKAKLAARGFAVLTPDAAAMDALDRVIFDELCRGEIRAESKRALLDVIARLAASGAEGAILGCTELGLLVSQRDTAVPLFDTTLLHAASAARWALTD